MVANLQLTCSSTSRVDFTQYLLKKHTIQLSETKLGAFVTSGVKGLIKQIGFHSYLQVNAGYSHPFALSPISSSPSLPAIRRSLHPPTAMRGEQ